MSALKDVMYDDLDLVWRDDDAPYPEGKEVISEIDFDRIREELEDDRREGTI